MTFDSIDAALTAACPGVRVSSVRALDAGHTSRQWVAETDEGPLLVKTPVRNPDPAHLRRLIATTRRAADRGIPVVRFRAFVPACPFVDGPLLVQEFVPGTPADAVWESMSTSDRLSFAAALGTLIGRLHRTPAPWFGDVLGEVRFPGVRPALHHLIETRLAKAPEGLLPAGIGAALHEAVDAVPQDARPSLTHRDLWRPNVVLDDAGRITCLLDFEHGGYGDRFLDFGKLEEHIFSAYPPAREPFLDAYAGQFPLPPDWRERIRLAKALHSLSTAVYFHRWVPEFVPQYVAELDDWLGSAGG